MKTALKYLIVIMTIVAFLPMHVYAADISYTYNSWDEPIGAPPAYRPEAVYYGFDFGISEFNSPTDMAIDSDGNIYILDSGNYRVVVIDREFNLIREINEWKYNGMEYFLDNPSGIDVGENNNLFITDTDNNKIIKTDIDGNILFQYTKPTSPIFPQASEYRPRKVGVDSGNNVYVIVDGIYHGAVMYNAEGEFQGFFGSSRVEITAAVLIDYFWKRIMSQEAISQMARYVPVNYNSIYFDSDDFMYVTAPGGEASRGEIRKLNPLGLNRLRTDTLEPANYGDKEIAYHAGIRTDSLLIDVCVDDEGFVFALDNTRGRVFKYDQESNLFAVFGGMGNSVGEFRRPVAVDSYGGRIFVLDSRKASLTSFIPTEYGELLRNALYYYHTGLYEEAIEPWHDVIKYNQNLDMAYAGIGKALLLMGEHEQSLSYLRTGYDRIWYSRAYRDYRTEFLRKYFPLVVLFAGLAIYGFLKILKKKRIAMATGASAAARYKSKKKWQYPIEMLRRPFDSFDDLKLENKYSLVISTAILALWVLGLVFQRQLTGFVFNIRKADELNMMYIFSQSVFIFAIWAVTNWAICTLFDGEGRFKEIWVATSYALIPYIVILYVTTFLSRFMIIEEGIFLTWLLYVGVAWSVLLIISAIKAVHQYEAGKTIGSILATIAGMLAVLFIIVLGYSLIQQLMVFLRTVFNEIYFIFREI